MRTRHRPSMMASALALIIAAATALVALTAAPALAYPGKPITDTSFYITSNSYSNAYNLGCNQGYKDAANGNRNSRMVIAFGTQAWGGNYLPASDTFISTDDVKIVSEEVAAGYWTCTGSDWTSTVYLSISTNNDGGTPTYDRGAAWGDVVTAIANWAGANTPNQVVVEGANDIEPSWSSYGDAIAWAQGFGDHFAGFYLDTASADGCPQYSASNGYCNNGWTQDDEYYITWGFHPAIVSPQIYYWSQARQWHMISLWGAYAYGGSIAFTGVLDEYPDDTSTFTADDAWNVFYSELSSTSQTTSGPYFSMEIVYE